MKLALSIITLLMCIVADNIGPMVAKDLDNRDNLSKENSRMYDDFEIIKLRIRRDGKSTLNSTKHHKRKHHPKMELIPADKSLQTAQFSAEIEEELGHTGIGKAPASGKRKRKRRGRGSFNQVLRKNRGTNELSSSLSNEGSENVLMDVTETKQEKDDDSGTILEEIHEHHIRKTNSHSKHKADESDIKNSDNHEENGQSDELESSGRHAKDVDAINTAGSTHDSKTLSHKDASLTESTLNGHDSKIDASDLHKVHSILAGKENDLVEEMMKLKDSLDEAIHLLRDKKQESSVPSKTQYVLNNVLVRAARAFSNKNFEAVRKREKRQEGNSLAPYRACIYIDIPGSQSDEDVEPFIPESMETSKCKTQEDSVTLNEDSEETTEDSALIDNENVDVSANSESQQPSAERLTQMEQGQDLINSNKDPDLEAIYWLKIQPTETVHSREVFEKLYNLVKGLHKSGKNVLFVPISKTYSNTDEVKRGFLKTLQIFPISEKNKLKQLKNFEIKLL